MKFHRLLPAAELWTGELRGFIVEGRRVLVLRLVEGVFAYVDIDSVPGEGAA